MIFAIFLLIILSSIRISIYNIDDINYVKVKFLIFTLYLENNRIIDIIKNFSITDTNFREQYKKLKNMGPLATEIIGKTVAENVAINKYFYKYDQTYQIVTLYILSSYFKSYIVSNMKLLKKYNYHINYSEFRNDIDFKIDLKISIIDLVFAVGSGLLKVLKNKNRSLVNGS